MTASPLKFDFALAMADGVGQQGGLTDSELDAETPSVERAVRRVVDEAASGILGFLQLPEDRTTIEAITRYARGVPEMIEHVLVLGIGGSSLGARAIDHALGHPVRGGQRRLHFPDNSDPWLLAGLLETLDARATMAIVISKSGGTVETAAQLLVVRRWLEEGGVAALSDHLLVITDPEKGPLRAMVSEAGLPSFNVPPNVGGRFSVLSAVGLVPAALAGYDVHGLIDGAAKMAEACRQPSLRDNPAAAYAAVHVLQHRLRHRPIHVLMPYGDALRPFAAWFVQLWAESLGKRRDRHGRIVELGPTPLPAVGATDQHAQVQLFVEGPRDKVVTFIAVEAGDVDLGIPDATGDFAYLSGHSLKELLEAERRGTTLALARDGRPSVTLTIKKIDASALGALFFFFEAATAIAGELYGIDAFDQPGVEEGKRLAFGLLGRPGFEAAADEVRDRERGRPPRYRVG